MTKQQIAQKMTKLKTGIKLKPGINLKSAEQPINISPTPPSKYPEKPTRLV